MKLYFEAFKNAGFNHVRIPVTWDDDIGNDDPYTVNGALMGRVEQVVDWALDAGLYVILNAHHETWLKTDYDNLNNQRRFDALWVQIADRFKDKPSKLLFEILNEPVGMTIEQVNDLNPRILEIIRRTNPTRLVVFAGNDYTPLESLWETEIPAENDNYLIGNFHSYDPWSFAGQCSQWWGSDEDLAKLEALYQDAEVWSQAHNIPVTVNEFGVAHFDFVNPANQCDGDARLAYLDAHVTFAKHYGLSATFWDDAGTFGSYNRSENYFGPEKDVLVAPNLNP